MFKFVHEKTFQTVVLCALLFYVFANPDTFKMVSKIPGFKFVMSTTKGITHSGVATHAIVFGLVLYLCVFLINTSLVKKNISFMNVVENFREYQTEKSDEVVMAGTSDNRKLGADMGRESGRAMGFADLVKEAAHWNMGDFSDDECQSHLMTWSDKHLSPALNKQIAKNGYQALQALCGTKENKVYSGFVKNQTEANQAARQGIDLDNDPQYVPIGGDDR